MYMPNFFPSHFSLFMFSAHKCLKKKKKEKNHMGLKKSKNNNYNYNLL